MNKPRMGRGFMRETYYEVQALTTEATRGGRVKKRRMTAEELAEYRRTSEAVNAARFSGGRERRAVTW